MFALSENFDIFNENFVFGSLMNINKNIYVFFKNVISDFDVDQFEFQRVLKIVDSENKNFVEKMVEKKKNIKIEESATEFESNQQKTTFADDALQIIFFEYSKSDNNNLTFESNSFFRYSTRRQ